MNRTVVAAVAVMLVVWTLPGTVTGVGAVDNEPPLADAGLDQEVEAGAWVMLDGGGSVDPDGEITSYEWSIAVPNGSTVTPECPTCERTEFRATDVGVYEVTLTVTDDQGASSSDTLYVTVADGDSGEPSVSLSGPDELAVGSAGTFTADLSAGTAPIERIEWQVDGETVANRSASANRSTATLDRSFSTPGAREVSVTLVDAEGRTANDSLAVQVRPASPDPGSALSVTIQGPDEVARGESASFEAAVAGAGGASVEYDWSNVDGSDGRETSRTFDESAGTEVVLSVVVRTDDGDRATATKTVEVTDPLPEIALHGPRFVDQGEVADFEVDVLRERHPVVWYSWEPADGTSDLRGSTYTRTFDEEIGETVNVTVTVHTGRGQVRATKTVRITETRGEPNGTKAVPHVGAVDATKRPRDHGDRHYWKFDAEVHHWGDEDVTVRWEFADGTTKRTTHDSLNGTTTSTVDVFFTYDPAEDPHDRPDGPRERGMPVSVTVTDASGDIKTADELFVVTQYPSDASPLGVSVFPSSKVRAGTPVTFEIGPVTAGEIDFGDGETRRFGTDPADGGAGSAEVTHTFDRRGTYTVEVWTDDGRYESVEIEAMEQTYTVYRYEKHSRKYWKTTAESEPRGDGWEKIGVDEVHWNYTDKKRTFRSGYTPSKIVESRNWKHVGTERRVEEQTFTKISTDDPGPGWTLVEENVEKDRRRVEYTFPDGTIVRSWETVYYHRYERTFVTKVPYKEWQYAERTVIYQWERAINITEITYSLTKPEKEDYVKGTLEMKTFNCSNKDAPKYEESCIRENEPQ